MISLKVGDVIDGRYELRRDLGCTATGLVFEARHRFTARTLAIKVLSPDVPRARLGELRSRMMREARALSAVRHPNLVEVVDAAILGDGTPYLVLEMLEGRTLEGLLAARGRLSPEVTVALALQVCDALAPVHAAGVVHRNLKPGNVFLVRDATGVDRIKLVDFGVAYVSDAREEKLTGVGTVLGTPAYMPPEQLLAEGKLDAPVDLYALGVTMFECLTGRLPYDGSDREVMLAACGSGPSPKVAEVAPAVPAALAEVVERAFARAQDDRFQSAKGLAEALERALPSGGTRVAGSKIISKTKIYDEPPEQRRRAARVPYSTSVRIVLEHAVIDGRTEDVSQGGVLVICREACEVGQRAEVRFALPLDGQLVTCTAQVRWVSAERPGRPRAPRAVGLEFVDPPPHVVATIARYVGQLGDPGNGY